MNIFLDHPERFAGAGSMSGVLDLGATKERFPVWEIVGKSSSITTLDGLMSRWSS